MCVFSETCRRLFQSICAAVTETTGWGLIPQTFTSHGLEAGRPRSRCQQVQCLLRACFLFSLSVRTWQKGALFFKGTDPVLGAPASLPDHLLIPLHWRLGSICRGGGRHERSVHNNNIIHNHWKPRRFHMPFSWHTVNRMCRLLLSNRSGELLTHQDDLRQKGPRSDHTVILSP